MSDHKLKKEDLDKINYINLKNKTSYSLMTAIGVVKDHLSTCQEKGHSGLCITDNGVMMASLDQYNQCKSANFPAVLGNSLSIVPDTRMKHLLVKANNVGIYVKNFNGYQNASFLTSIGSENEKFYKTPRIDFHDLFENKEGLILTCGGFTGVISQAILQKKGLIKKVLLKNINNTNLINFVKSNKEISLDQITEIMNLLIHEKEDEKDIRIFLNDKINYQSFKFILLTEETHKVLEESFPIKKDKIDLIPTPSAEIEEDKDGKVDVKKRDEAKRVSESVFYNAINIIQEFSAEDLIESFKKEFKDDFYLELSFLPKDKYWDREEKTHLELDEDPNEQIIKKYIELSENYKVKIVATQESYMKNQEDHLLQSIMLWNRPGSKDGFYFPLAQYIMTLEEMYDLMQENYSFLTDDQFLEWTSNTEEFIEKSKDLALKFRPSLPNLPYEDHYVNKVPVVIQRKLMNRLQEEELWNEEIKARIKKNKSIQDEELVSDSLKEEFPTEESCINFEEMKEREKENIFLEETLNKMEDFYKDTDPAFVKLLKKSQKDLPLRTSLKVMMRNKKIAPRKVDEEKMQALIDKNPKTKGKKFSEFPIEQMERIAEKKGFFVSDTDPMLLLGNEIVRDRLTYELNTIQYNGILKLITYFMLLEDVSNFINENPSAEKGLGRGCLTGDAFVLTKDEGYKELKNIKEGDEVYTENGESKKVIKTFKYPINEEILEINTSNNINNIRLTPDHKILGIKRIIRDKWIHASDRQKKKIKKYKNYHNTPQWDEAENFNEGDLLFVPKVNRKIKDIDYLDMANYVSDNFVYNEKLKGYHFKDNKSYFIKRYIKFDENIAYVIGKWIGDGSYRFKKEERRYELNYHFNSNETEEIQKTIKIFKEYFGVEANIYQAKNRNLTNVSFFSYPLSLMFKEMFSNYKSTSSTKSMESFKYLPDNKLISLMKGYISADGHITKDSETIDTVSLQLALDVREILQYLNIPFSWTERKPYYRGDYLCKKSYKIRFRGINLKRRDESFIEDNGYYVKIKDIKKYKKKINVYDLMIEDNPSYLTSNFLVHNSGAGSIVAHALDITDCDPLQYDLLFERFLTKERIGEVFTDLDKFSLEEFKEMINSKETKSFIEAFGLNKISVTVNDLSKELEKDEEDLSKELQKLFIKERDTEDLKQWKEDELFFMECNPENLVYYIFMKNNLPKEEKLKNINNSTLAYLIGLTDDKPTDAMNATPTTLPDIDYDTNARDEIKEYLVNKFGREKVTLMGTFGTLKTKGAIKDVLRQLRPDMSFKDVNILTKNFEQIKETDYKSDLEYLDAGINEVKELKDYFDQNPEVLECVKNILGNVKSTGIHAGGVVVAGEDVTRVVPCHFERKKENMWVTQPDMKYVEWAGLIKYDLLGLNTLNDLNRAFRLIEKRTGKQIDGKKIPLNDPAVMRRFRKGDVMSIFQFGSALFKNLVTQLNEINNINDLAIITSINRPGPLDMGMDKSFIKRVNKEEPITYFHPSLEPILKDTYGITCYQEQVMSIVREVGGLTGNESVVVLKAMGKKQLDKLMKFKKKFLDEAVKKYPEMGDVVDFEDPESKEMIKVPLAEKIWLYLEAFAKYGFNKSHAIAYSTVSYYCMWLKHYYEIEWITAVLSGSSKDDFKEFYSQWYDKVLKPDINKSKKDYIIETVGDTDKCIMPFSFINGVGDKAVQSIVSCQPFASFEDFFQRVDKRRVNKTSIINLIMSGTFDSLKDSICQDKITKMEEQTSSIKEKITEGKISPEERVDLIEEGKGLKSQIEKLKDLPIADYRKMLIKDFFDLKAKQKKPSKKERLEIDAFMEELEEMNRGHFLMKEVSLLNLTAFNYYEFYKDHMTRGALAKFGKEAITPEQALKAKDRTKVVVGGAIESIKVFPIKNGKNRGKNMAKLTLINKDSKIGITVFSNKLETDSSGRNMIRDLEEFTPVIIEGTIQRDPKWGTSILFNKGWDLSK